MYNKFSFYSIVVQTVAKTNKYFCHLFWFNTVCTLLTMTKPEPCVSLVLARSAVSTRPCDAPHSPSAASPPWSPHSSSSPPSSAWWGRGAGRLMTWWGSTTNMMNSDPWLWWNIYCLVVFSSRAAWAAGRRSTARCCARRPAARATPWRWRGRRSSPRWSTAGAAAWCYPSGVYCILTGRRESREESRIQDQRCIFLNTR